MVVLPGPTHPIWKTSQQLMSIVVIAIAIWHQRHAGAHLPTDSTDALGGLVVAKELGYFLSAFVTRRDAEENSVSLPITKE